MSTMLFVTIIMAIVYYRSLAKSKTLINGCLIKVGNKPQPVKSAKQ
jgi:hypothetical protein